MQNIFQKGFWIFVLSVMLLMKIAVGQELVQTVRGRVTDLHGQFPLAGANVLISSMDPARGASTDQDGYFRIENIPVGRISLKISYVGYKDVILNGIEHISAKESLIMVEMESIILTGEVVEVKASMDKSKAINQMASVSARSFTIDETQRYAGSRSDVARMASNFAGVQGANDSRNDIIIRGNSPSFLLWRMEGVDIPSPNHWAMFGTTGGPVSILNNNLLANSDFFTGAFPAEYGNSLSGVFDLKMRPGNNEQHEFLGQMGFNGVEFGAEGPLFRDAKGSYLVNARYSTMEVFDAMGISFGTSGVPKYQDLSFKINLPQTRLGSISLFGLGGHSTIDLWDSKKDTSEVQIDFYGGEGFDLTNAADVAVVGLSNTYIVDQSFYSKTTIAATYQYSGTRIDSLTPVTMAKTAWYRSNLKETKLFGSWIANKRFNSKNYLKTGIMASMSLLNLFDSVYISRDKAFRDVSAFSGDSWLIQPYVSFNHRFSDALNLNVGLHYQYFLLNKHQSVEPRLGLSWEVKPGQTISIGAGRHGQLLPITQYFELERLADGSYVNLKKNAPFMISHHLVMGFQQKLGVYAHIKIEGYYQSLSQIPVCGNKENFYSMLNEGANFVVSSPDTISSKGTGYNYGIEITVERFLYKGFYGLFTASLFDSKAKGSDGIIRNTAFNTNYVFNLLAGKEWSLPQRSKKKIKDQKLGVNIKSTWSGGQRYIPYMAVWNENSQSFNKEYDYLNAYADKYKDYFRTDLNISYKVSEGKITQEWAVEITNLFDNKNIFNQAFNTRTGESTFNYQLGIMVIPQWIIHF